MKKYLSRRQSKFWSSEIPVGDPFGGAAYSERNDPVTIATVASYASIAGTALAVVGAINQGQQAKNASEYNAAVAQNNAVAARQQAEANAAAQERKARLQIGSMRAGYGASGIGLEGSPLDVIEQSAAMAELDRQNILYSGQLRTQGYESTAGLEVMRGENAVTGSYFQAGSSLLSGVGRYAVPDANQTNPELKRVG